MSYDFVKEVGEIRKRQPEGKVRTSRDFERREVNSARTRESSSRRGT